jgi:hypothetical protein
MKDVLDLDLDWSRLSRPPTLGLTQAHPYLIPITRDQNILNPDLS